MTEPETVPDPQPDVTATPVTIPDPPPPAAPPPEPPPMAAKPAKSGGLWPLLGIIGFLILAAGEAYLWRLDQIPHQAAPAAGGVTPAQLADLQNQVEALQLSVAKTQPAPNSIATQADQAEKLAVISAQIAALQTEFAADHAAVTTLTTNSAGLAKLTARIETLNQLADARMALDSGQPLGTIPNAPPALAAFATAKPPTMAELVLTYPQAAAAANAASVDKATKNSFWARVLARLENLVTISNGDHVIIGAPAAAITAQAQTQLDAGDLAGAVATLTDNLSPTTQAALGNWLAQAKSLLAARAAIVQMSQS